MSGVSKRTFHTNESLNETKAIPQLNLILRKQKMLNVPQKVFTLKSSFVRLRHFKTTIFFFVRVFKKFINATVN